MMCSWSFAVREMGGEHWARFAFDNGTAVVPSSHPGHPRNLLARGFSGAPPLQQRIKITRWHAGTHYYATLDGNDVFDADGGQKWNTYELAQAAAERQAAIGQNEKLSHTAPTTT